MVIYSLDHSFEFKHSCEDCFCNFFPSRTPHESLPLQKGAFRQFFRLVTSQVCNSLLSFILSPIHSTPNPLVNVFNPFNPVSSTFICFHPLFVGRSPSGIQIIRPRTPWAWSQTQRSPGSSSVTSSVRKELSWFKHPKTSLVSRFKSVGFYCVELFRVLPVWCQWCQCEFIRAKRWRIQRRRKLTDRMRR